MRSTNTDGFMDRAKLVVKVVVAAGLAFVWPGPAVLEWVTTPDPAFPPPTTVAPVPAPPAPAAAPTGEDPMAAARRWLAAAKPHCNAVEVGGRIDRTPPPPGWEGQAHAAACLALAGRTDEARARIEPLTDDERWRAVGIVFETGHPAADAGDEVAAGPLMELVVEFWPNHYMALYHAGAAAFERGEFEKADEYLERFLAHYEPEDFWRVRALAMLTEIEGD